MATVKLENIQKHYGEKVVVKGVDLEIADGEFLVLVGPSGCGKSTTLRMIAGLEEITAGKLYIGGRLVNDVPPKDRNIAMVFQSYALYPHMTVRENMAFGLKMRKVSKEEIAKKVEYAAEILELTPLLDRLPKDMSGGQRQRVAMGRAIVRDPDVFLFDEPLSNLDAKLRVAMRAEIARLHQRLKTTIVYVTHDQVEAMTLADRIVVFHAGIVQQVGAPLDLYNFPANKFVGGFIGSPSMNFIDFTYDGSAIKGAGVNWALSGDYPESGSLGIRPQDLEVENSAGLAVEGTVDVIEPMGAETYIHMRIGEKGQVILAKIPVTASPVIGEKFTVYIPKAKVHLFGRDEKAIKHGL